VDLLALTAEHSYTYDAADRVTLTVYPDGEAVGHGYDQAGRPKSLVSWGLGTTYVSNMTYDAFGRTRTIVRGNGTTDTHTYHGLSQSYRLQSMQTKKGSTTHHHLTYADYTPHGLLKQLTDTRFSSAPLSATSTYTYDGLGRLTNASGTSFSGSYEHNALGNLTKKENDVFKYETPSKPHQVTKVGGTGIQHDGNGNRRPRRPRLRVRSRGPAAEDHGRRLAGGRDGLRLHGAAGVEEGG
jgi:YD repeat-containing protein